jgi:hypothetical protein
MSLAIHRPDDMPRRRPRRKQEPSLAVTEGRLVPTARIARPPRRLGRGGHTEAERLMVQDLEIARLDEECRPRWEIAAITGLCESQVYRRLKRLRERRLLMRAAQSLMDDDPRYG